MRATMLREAGSLAIGVQSKADRRSPRNVRQQLCALRSPSPRPSVFTSPRRTRAKAFSSYREFVPPESEAQALMDSARSQFEELVKRGDHMEGCVDGSWRFQNTITRNVKRFRSQKAQQRYIDRNDTGYDMNTALSQESG
eukprot:1196317-Prorocentrum_minimum.AAC.4